MSFSDFIEGHVDAVMAEWESLARTMPSARRTSRAALRDHWPEILRALAAEMRLPRGDEAPSALRAASEALSAPAREHGLLRQAREYELDELVAEYRVMRAAVLRLWRRSEFAAGDALSIDEMARFTEALDQALAESIERFSSSRAKVRDLFLAMLGHDLRDPLSAIEMATHVLDRSELESATRLRTVVRVRRAVTVMSRLVTDMLDFTRSRLGSGLPIERTRCDLARLCEDALDSVQASFPEHRFAKHLSGDLALDGDAARITQMLSNLLYNAVQHGDALAPVSLRACGEADAVLIEIANSGPPIPPEAMNTIFEPLKQGPKGGAQGGRSRTSIGLGLYIVREIVHGHGGRIDVKSVADGDTVFAVRLPRA